MLLNHEKSQFEITCYSCSSAEDDFTRDFHRAADHWRDVAQLSDNELSDLIRADKIDILVDLSGHTAGHRLGVFAGKPAPIQVSAGFTGTGVPTIDYLFSEAVICPEAFRHLFAERIYDLPSVMTIEPLPKATARSNLPALTKGYMTFGVFNRANKTSEVSVAVWARLLHCLPQSRILMKHFGFDDELTRTRVQKMFAAHEVSAERITLLGTTTRLDHLAAFAEVDISLDTFPQNGGIRPCGRI
jgi:predicted O-linked N-acetylglucosamine transferase (SPINDLY family)